MDLRPPQSLCSRSAPRKPAKKQIESNEETHHVPSVGNSVWVDSKGHLEGKPWPCLGNPQWFETTSWYFFSRWKPKGRVWSSFITWEPPESSVRGCLKHGPLCGGFKKEITRRTTENLTKGLLWFGLLVLFLSCFQPTTQKSDGCQGTPNWGSANPNRG